MLIAGNFASLNPCCDGRCSSTPKRLKQPQLQLRCLNPCCDGRCSSTVFNKIVKHINSQS